MKKVLIIANYDVGLYKFRKELIQELLNKNYEVFISLPNGVYVPELIRMGCKFIETNVNRRGMNVFGDLKLFLNYRKILKDIKPDVILTYTIKPNIYGGIASKQFKIPYIANVTGLGTAVEKKGKLQWFILKLYKFALKKADCVFVQNQENKNFFNERKLFSGNNKLIPGSGVNLKDYSVLNYPSEDEIHFLFIARVMKEKGIDLFLEAATYIKEIYPNTYFHVLGFCEQEYEEKLTRMEGMEIIKYHGMQTEMQSFHKISHCTIHPTYYPEGMSNVLLESAACGRPVIATNRSGCREIVVDGESGYLIKEKNSQDLIDKIVNFINLPHERKKEMGLTGRKWIEENFDRKIIVKEYMTEISKAVK